MRKYIHIPNSLTLVFFLTIPFSAFGFYYQSFLVSLSLLPLLLINFICILNGRFNKKLFIYYLLFIGICFFSSFVRHPIESFLPPLIILIFLLLPFTTALKLKNLQRYIIYSFALLSVYSLLELIIGLFSNEMMFNIENSLSLKGSTTTYRGIRRLRAGFLEPSVFGLALNFYLLVFIYIKSLSNRFKIFLILLCIFWIILTFSSAAYVGLMINIIFFIYLKLKSVKFSFKLSWRSILSLFSFGIIITFSIQNFFDPIYKAFEKILLIPEVIMLANVTGSVGYRINSLIVAPSYIIEAELFEKFFGTGFSNYSEYLISKFGNNEFSGFYDGQIGNILSAILLSTGLLGFISFILFIKKALHLNNKIMNIHFLILSLITMVGFGDLTSVWIWGVFFLTVKTLKEINENSF